MTNFREVPPPPELEQRVVDTLRSRGFLRMRRFSAGVAIAAAIVLAVMSFVGGVALQRGRAATTTSSSAPRFMLLLYGDSAPGERDSLTAEFHEWTDGLRRSGRYVAGAELAPQFTLVSQSDPAGGAAAPSGAFIYTASDVAEATRIARECPHVRRGGQAILRPVVPPRFH